MEIALGMFLCIGAFFDIWKRRLPNLLAIATLTVLFFLLAYHEAGIDLSNRVLSGVIVYILFFWFYRFGLFGGGDGKAAALMTMAMGWEAFLEVLLIGCILGITIGVLKMIRTGSCEIFQRMKVLFQTLWRFGLSTPSLIRLEVREGERLPFLPCLFSGYLVYLTILGGR